MTNDPQPAGAANYLSASQMYPHPDDYRCVICAANSGVTMHFGVGNVGLLPICYRCIGVLKGIVLDVLREEAELEAKIERHVYQAGGRMTHIDLDIPHFPHYTDTVP